MDFKFDLNDQEKSIVKDILTEIYEKSDSKKTLKENIKDFYITKFPQVKEEEAQDVAAKILKGVNDFSNSLDEVIEGDLENWVFSKLEDKIEGLSDEEVYECKLNFLLAMTAVNKSSLEKLANLNKEEWQEDIEGLKSMLPYIDPEKITPWDIKELDKLLSQEIANTGVLLQGITRFDDMIENLERDITIDLYIEDEWENEVKKVYTSMAAYIAYKNGEFKNMEANIPPEVIAINISAGITADDIIKKAASGKISSETASKILTIISAVAVTLVLLAVAVFAAKFMIVTGTLFSAIFGIGIISSVVWMGIGVWAGAMFLTDLKDWIYKKSPKLKECVTKTIDDIKNKLKEIKDIIICKIVPQIKEYICKVWEFIKSKLEQCKVKFKDKNEEDVETQTSKEENVEDEKEEDNEQEVVFE